MIEYLFDGVDSEQTNEHTFVSLMRDGKGCDCYFDGVGGISEVIDWQHGNGILAHDLISEERATEIAIAIIMGHQIDGVRVS